MSYTINDFTEELIAELKTADASLTDSEILMRDRELPGNVTRKAFCIKRPGASVAPLIYLDDIFQAFSDGIPVKDIASGLLKYLNSCNFPNLDTGIFRDFGSVKGRIICSLIPGGSDKYLSDHPSLPLGDTGIRIVWFISLSKDYMLPVTNQLAGCWEGVSIPKIHAYALINTPRLRPMRFSPVNDIIAKFYRTHPDSPKDRPGVPPAEGAYVLTNRDSCDGTAAILYPDAKKALSKAFPHGCWLIPSSRHEWIAADKDVYPDPDRLRIVVRIINSGDIRPDEILSDDIFELQDGMPVRVK